VAFSCSVFSARCAAPSAGSAPDLPESRSVLEQSVAVLIDKALTTMPYPFFVRTMAYRQGGCARMLRSPHLNFTQRIKEIFSNFGGMKKLRFSLEFRI